MTSIAYKLLAGLAGDHFLTKSFKRIGCIYNETGNIYTHSSGFLAENKSVEKGPTSLRLRTTTIHSFESFKRCLRFEGEEVVVYSSRNPSEATGGEWLDRPKHLRLSITQPTGLFLLPQRLSWVEVFARVLSSLSLTKGINQFSPSQRLSTNPDFAFLTPFIRQK